MRFTPPTVNPPPQPSVNCVMPSGAGSTISASGTLPAYALSAILSFCFCCTATPGFFELHLPRIPGACPRAPPRGPVLHPQHAECATAHTEGCQWPQHSSLAATRGSDCIPADGHAHHPGRRAQQPPSCRRPEPTTAGWPGVCRGRHERAQLVRGRSGDPRTCVGCSCCTHAAAVCP